MGLEVKCKIKKFKKIRGQIFDKSKSFAGLKTGCKAETSNKDGDKILGKRKKV